ncbi:MAG: glycosyl transferase family 2, partial [Candidatus Aenigmatarchaeota archaeon]
IMDADHTYDPKDIPKLLNIAPQYDQVIGLRTNRQNIPFLHRIGNNIISFAISLLLGQRIRDPCSGMYLLKTDIAKNLELTSTSFDIEAEIASQVATLGKVVEIPINYRKRIGKKKINTWKDGLKILLTTIKIAWLYNPIFLLSAVASTLAIPGITILIWQLYLRYTEGSAWSIGWAWLGLILLITGLQAFTTATITLLLKRMERRMIQTIRQY